MKKKSITKKLENGERTKSKKPDAQTPKKLAEKINKPIPGKDKPDAKKRRGAKKINRYGDNIDD